MQAVRSARQLLKSRSFITFSQSVTSIPKKSWTCVSALHPHKTSHWSGRSCHMLTAWGRHNQSFHHRDDQIDVLRYFSSSAGDGWDNGDEDGEEDSSSKPSKKRKKKKAKGGGDEEGGSGSSSSGNDDDSVGAGGNGGDADDDDDNRNLAKSIDDNDQLMPKDNPKGFPGFSVQSIHVPEEYPEVVVLAVPRAIFPPSSRMVTVSDKRVIELLKKLVKQGRPWIGAFLRKPSEEGEEVPSPDPNLITSRNAITVKEVEDVHDMGVFCHVALLGEDKFKREVVVLQSIRRIKIKGKRVDESDMRPPPSIPAAALEPSKEEESGSTSSGEQENQEAKDANQQQTEQPLDELIAVVENAVEDKFDPADKQFEAYRREILSTIKELMHNTMYREHVIELLREVGQDLLYNPSVLADFATLVVNCTEEQQQEVLDELDVGKRLSLALDLLKTELVTFNYHTEIGKQVEEKINKARKQHILMEQLNVIKRELGITKDDKDAVADKFKKRLEGLTVPEDAKAVIDEEMNKLETLDENSSEFNVTRNYLDWLTILPWGQTTTDLFDIKKALEVLDKEHYGMKDVKDRILEFIAVGKLRGQVQGKILCFVGPPGVGKTSIAKSIAEALDRKYYRFSVGGMSDVAEIKGHRRTYVGAMPGKMIQCLKATRSENPLVLIDEVDKMGRGHQGDPAAALLELLDPEQNSNFLDHYLDVPVDLSKVLFLCTANSLDTIPGPLLDRMEIIELSGYIQPEKVAISENYLLPMESKNTGVDDSVTISTGALENLIRWYCRESGVRQLQKKIERIYRKAALILVRDGVDKVEVTEDNLKDFVGNPIFTSDRMYDTTPPGVVMGLAWTSHGGSALYIETTVTPKSASKDDSGPGLNVTGNLGDVMKESCKIAYSYAKSFHESVDSSSKFFAESLINLHVPEGATPKDGPSAGVTMVTAFMSLALDTPVRSDIAMTGEVSLTGKVLRVGGIKEKVIAAKRAGTTCIVLPDSCRTDFEELPEQVKDGLEVHFVGHYNELFPIAFPNYKG